VFIEFLTKALFGNPHLVANQKIIAVVIEALLLGVKSLEP
jgi:hypothetical protein